MDQVATVFLNGEFLPLVEAKVPVLDRGFIFGDGVYEVVPVYSKVAFRLDEHLARLERSLAAVGIRNPYTREQWRGFVEGIVARQPLRATIDGCAATSSPFRSSAMFFCASSRPRPTRPRPSSFATLC